MIINFYQAECGDAARVSYFGTDNKSYNIFIDSGYNRTFKYVLDEEIRSIETSKQRIDLWIISHIHDDHIGGVEKYIKKIVYGEFRDLVATWYFNPPRSYSISDVGNDLKKISKASSIGQGDDLYLYLKKNNKLIDSDITTEMVSQNFGGLKISILSPSPKKLMNLRNKYPIELAIPLERNEFTSTSEAVSFITNDYDTPLENFDLEDWEEDTSEENGSSISLLTDFEGKIILWLADSHPSDIVQSLNALGYTPENKLKCDLVKVSHHGSRKNNSNELYDLIDCSKYLISANGENRSKLPTKKCLGTIIRNRNRDVRIHYEFYFTYDNMTLRGMFNSDPETIFTKWNFSLHYNSKKSINMKF